MAANPDQAGLDGVLAAVNAGDLATAERRCRQAIEDQPDLALARHYLGTVLSLAGDAEGARRASLRAVELDPALFKAHFNLGVMAEGTDDDEALTRYRTVLKLAPDHFGARINAGNVLMRQGELAEAIDHFSRATEIEPDNPIAYNSLGGVHLKLDNASLAVEAFRKALSLDPGYEEARLNLAAALNADGAPEEAIQILERHLEDVADDAPGRAEVENTLGVIARDNGRLEEAETRFRAAIAHRPDYALAYGNLADVARLKSDDPVVHDLQAIRAELPAGSIERMALDFACAGIFDRSGRYDEAFAALEAANGVRRALVAFDPNQRRRLVDEIIGQFGTDNPAPAAEMPVGPAAPLFIVGMPRSGTTLLEQMLCAHDAVTTAGESRELGEGISDLWTRMGRPYPTGVDETPVSALGELADRYRSHLAGSATDETFVINKMPSNYHHIGLIFRLFPGARVIHMRRDPADNCLSLLFANLGARFPYSCDQHELSEAYRDYARLTTHWDDVFGDRILNVRYEQLTSDPEAELSRVLGYLGLAFESACLRPHEQAGHVRTASVVQIRQPINTKSIGRWRRYEDLLSPEILDLRSLSAFAYASEDVSP